VLTEQQKKNRTLGIGGTDVAAIAGEKNKYWTAMDVFLEKTGAKPPKDLSGNPYTYWGHKHEKTIAEVYSEQTGKQLQETDQTFYHPKYNFLLCHIDRLIVGEKAVLECKTASAYKADAWGETSDGKIPSEYLLQVAYQALILDLEYVDVAVLIGGNDFRVFRYHRNPALEENIVTMCVHFWEQHVLTGIPPAPVVVQDVSTLYPEDNAQTLTSTPELVAAVQEYHNLSATIMQLSAAQEKIKLQLAEALAENAYLMDPAGEKKLVTYKASSRKSFDLSTFKTENPELYEKYQQQTYTRPLRIFNI